MYNVCLLMDQCWPWRIACAMRSLAIVNTIVQSLFLSFFSFSPSFAFDPLRGNSRVQKFVSPNNLVILIFLPKKRADFFAFFRLFTASVRSRPPGPPAVPGVFLVHFLKHFFKTFFFIFSFYIPSVEGI